MAKAAALFFCRAEAAERTDRQGNRWMSELEAFLAPIDCAGSLGDPLAELDDIAFAQQTQAKVAPLHFEPGGGTFLWMRHVLSPTEEAEEGERFERHRQPWRQDEIPEAARARW